MKYVKYRVQKQQVSYDGGETWEDTGETRKGEYIGVYDTAEDCANATVPPHDTPLPQANPNAKATLILDDGSEVDLPFTGFHSGSTHSDPCVDDYAFTFLDTSMTFTGWDNETKDYVAQHCVKMIISDQVRYVCHHLEMYGLNFSNIGWEGYLTFLPDGTVAGDIRKYYFKLEEIVLPSSVELAMIDGNNTQINNIRYSNVNTVLRTRNLYYIRQEMIIPEGTLGGSMNTADVVIDCRYGYVGGYDCTPRLLVTYIDHVPQPISTLGRGTYTYVRDELLDGFVDAYLDTLERPWIAEIPFFPLSFYNVDFREPNDNEKFVARLDDGTLYSIPIGNGIVTSGDVESIKAHICDIKFGSGVSKINNGVFGLVEGGVAVITQRHSINLVEFNSNVDMSTAMCTINIDKVKINGNNYYGIITGNTEGRSVISVARHIYVPDESFAEYVKSLPKMYATINHYNENSLYYWRRLKIRPMSKYKINS